MPGILPKYDPNDKKVNELGNVERKKRLKLIDAYWTYYRDGGARKPLKVRSGQPDDNVMLNLSAQGIDRLVSFFAPAPPRFTVPGGVNREPSINGLMEVVKSPEQLAIESFLDTSEFDHQIVDIALSGFISGHNFIRLYMPDNTDSISPENPPRLGMLDPRHVTKFWAAGEMYKTLFYRLMWQVEGDVFRRQDIVPTWLERRNTIVDQQPDLSLGWEIIEYQGKGESGDYKEVSRDHWEFPFAPVIDWKNAHAPHECYGESDLRHADLNDAVNFIASNTARIIKYHAHPKSVGVGVDPGAIKTTSVDGFYTIPENTSITNLEMQSDLSSSLNYLDVLRNAFFTQMHVIDMSGIKDKVGALTNFAVRMLFKDMLDLIDSKHSLYGNGLAETIKRAMIMMGFADIAKPKDEWQDPLPVDKLELVTALKTEKELGAVSVQTIQEDLKRDPVVEAERKAEETSNSTDALVNTLVRVGQEGGGGLLNTPNPLTNGSSQRMPLAR